VQVLCRDKEIHTTVSALPPKSPLLKILVFK